MSQKVKLVIGLANIERAECGSMQQINAYKKTVRVVIDRVITSCGEVRILDDSTTIIVPIEKLECVKGVIEDKNGPFPGKVINEKYL